VQCEQSIVPSGFTITSRDWLMSSISSICRLMPSTLARSAAAWVAATSRQHHWSGLSSLSMSMWSYPPERIKQRPSPCGSQYRACRPSNSSLAHPSLTPFIFSCARLVRPGQSTTSSCFMLADVNVCRLPVPTHLLLLAALRLCGVVAYVERHLLISLSLAA
jgi:hypothetical protein